jgi:hypothetical protein
MFQALQIIFKINKQQIRIYTRRNLLKQFGVIDLNLQWLGDLLKIQLDDFS